MELAMRGPRWLVGVTLLFRARQVRREFLAHGIRNRRIVIGKSRERCLQRTFACAIELPSHRILVMQVERAQQRLECQPLNHECSEYDSKRREHD